MKPALDPVVLARAVELTISLEHAWPDQCQSVPTLALAVAASAPNVQTAELLVLGKLGAWICAFHDSLEAVPASYVEQRIARYQALVCRAAASPLAGDRAATMLIDVLVALRAAPLGGSLWPLFSTQLAATLESTRWATPCHGSDRSGSWAGATGSRLVETYVAHAGASSFIAPLTTAAAILIGEPVRDKATHVIGSS
jgi:hypothetical protein